MHALRSHPLARADIQHEARWYDEKRRGLGSEFLDEVEHTIDLIAEHPLRFSIRFGNWRRANLRRFPYAIFYQLIEKEPVIFAVLHTRRDVDPILNTRSP